ncbi:614_t:CDS:10 [Entrophospora sp. SA101]|nr:614_t:CDS:10 [Entrophospora sp. SA101]
MASPATGNNSSTNTFTTTSATTVADATIQQLEPPPKKLDKGKEKMTTFQPDYSTNNPFLKKLEDHNMDATNIDTSKLISQFQSSSSSSSLTFEDEYVESVLPNNKRKRDNKSIMDMSDSNNQESKYMGECLIHQEGCVILDNEKHFVLNNVLYRHWASLVASGDDYNIDSLPVAPELDEFDESHARSLPQEINKDHSITPLQKLLAAYKTPFDVIKTRSQSQNVSNNNTFSDIKPLASTSYSSTSLALPSFSDATATLPPSTQKVDSIVKIACYKGIMVRSITITVSYDHTIDKLWANWKGKYSEVYSPLIAGATPKTTSASIISQLEPFRIKSQGSESINGLRGVLNGVQTMIFNNVNNVEVRFLSGDISGDVALIATPFDVSKTMRQVSIIQCSRFER